MKQPKKIYFSFNGMDCFYYSTLLNNPYEMERLAKELQKFQDTFFDNGEVSWGDCVENNPDEFVFDVFSNYHYLENDLINRVKSILEEYYLTQQEITTAGAFEKARKELKIGGVE